MDQQAAAIEQIGSYVAERYPMYRTDAGFEHWLYSKAGLNKELLDRYLSLLDDYGFITGEGKISSDYQNLPNPEHVRKDIERRLADLAPDVIDALRVASVEGDRFSTDIVARLRGSSAGLDRLLAAATHAGVIAPESNASRVAVLEHQFRFVPLQTRDVVYGGLSNDERLRLHSELVELLSAEAERVSDPGEQDMLHQLISEHNKAVARPDPPSKS